MSVFAFLSREMNHQSLFFVVIKRRKHNGRIRGLENPKKSKENCHSAGKRKYVSTNSNLNSFYDI